MRLCTALSSLKSWSIAWGRTLVEKDYSSQHMAGTEWLQQT